MTDAVDDVLERLWSVHRGRTRERLQHVTAGVQALARGEQVDAEHLTRTAHALAGALGTYGRPGSDLLREVEGMLAGRPAAATAADLGQRLQDLQRRLDV